MRMAQYTNDASCSSESSVREFRFYSQINSGDLLHASKLDELFEFRDAAGGGGGGRGGYGGVDGNGAREKLEVTAGA